MINITDKQSNLSLNIPSWRVLFLGTRGVLSQIVLTALLDAGVQVCGVIVPADGATAVAAPIQPLKPKPTTSQLPLLNPFVNNNILHTAWAHDLPIYAVNDFSIEETQRAIKALQPELGCVACYPKRLPAVLRHLPTRGFWNLHPSLLPAYRGPAPLFWMLRDGVQKVGVTVHQMDANFDSGAILIQDIFTLNDGIRGPEADEVLAKKGAALMLQALAGMAQEKLTPTPQPTGGTYFSWPQADDFNFPVTWAARRAFNFMRGTAEWKRPFTIHGPNINITARFAITFDPEAKIENEFEWNGRDVTIQFNPGTLHVTT